MGCGSGCGCGPCSQNPVMQHVAARSPEFAWAMGMRPPVGALGTVPTGIPGWFEQAVSQARTAGDLVNVLSAAWSKLTSEQTRVRDTYVGGKHQREEDLAARKLVIARRLAAVRMQYAQYLQRLDQLSPNDPIPPDVMPLVRETGGFSVVTPMAFAPWVYAAEFDQLVSEAGERMKGNLPQIPGVDEWMIWAIGAVILFGVVLSKTEFRVEL